MENQAKNALKEQGTAIASKLDQRFLQIEQKGEGLARATSNLANYDTNAAGRCQYRCDQRQELG